MAFRLPSARYAVVTEQRPAPRCVRARAGPRGSPLTTERAHDPAASDPGAVPLEHGPVERTAPGVRASLRGVRVAVTALIAAHVTLLKAELEGLVAELKVIAALAGAILVLALFVAQLLAIGGALFVGEWLFGSLGWGIVHGTLLAIALIVATAMLLVETPRRVIVTPLVLALIVGMAVTVALGANLARRGAEQLSAQLRSGPLPHLDPAWAPAVVGAAAGAVVLALVGLVLLGRLGGTGGAVAGVVVGAISGGLLGWGWTGLTFSWQGAVAIGVAVGLLTWIALMPAWMLRAEIDPTARFRRLWPRESYAAALETKDWLEKEWAKRRSGLGRT
jgi:hypothetical protein